MKRIFLQNLFLVLSLNSFSQGANSVLSTGTWYKIGVTADGIYKLTYQNLVDLGVPVASIDPHNIRIFGNGGGMLPMQNNIPRPLDLSEVAIKVKGEANGFFDTNDYILFYGQSQHRWKYDSLAQRFRHTVNVYSDTTYYFLNCDIGPGMRIPSEPSVTQPANQTISSFSDYQFHEFDSVNFLRNGREWYGEEFTSLSPMRTFQFTFPDMDLNTPAVVYTQVLGRSFLNVSEFQLITPGGIKLVDIPVTSNSLTSDYAKVEQDSTGFLSPSSSFQVSLNFLSTDTSERGWLNWMEVFARRNLVMSGSSLFFRDQNSVGNGNISSFNILNAAADSVWDITNHNYPKEILRIPGTSEHRVQTDMLRQFVCFDEAASPSPFLVGPIPNQNLRGLPLANLVIITPSEFLNAANDLAAHHISYDGLSVNVVEVNKIYNEFSSGAQDVTAIHDFISLFYNPSNTFKYVLLLGDASYDYKYRLPGNTNIVPGFQSVGSLNLTTCYGSDDYFVYMDSTEGENEWVSASVDLAIGRLPAKNISEAELMVGKIIHYATNSVLDNWRKQYILCADDEDNNTHLTQAEWLAEKLDTTHCDYDLEKIYIDAFQQDTVPNGWRYPEVSALLQKRFDEGFLYANFTGHSGETWFVDERIFDATFIDTLQNLDHLPFITLFGIEFNTCDDPAVISGGERLLLNPTGGAIGCFSGTTLCFSGSNFSLCQRLTNYILEPDSGFRIGDICMKAKHEYADRYTKNFVLLGDPAVRLKYPENKIVLTSFNGGQLSSVVDTLPLGSTISATGEVQNPQGQLLNSFNGSLKILLLRNNPDSTLANDFYSTVREFDTWSDTLYEGIVNVSSGVFNFTFTIPSNTSQFYEAAKLSMYSENGITDATGCYDKMMIGNIFYSVNELDELSGELIVSPNPASADVEIKLTMNSEYPLRLSVFDTQGRNVMTINYLMQNSFHINCENIARGFYFLSLEDEKNKLIGKGKLMLR